MQTFQAWLYEHEQDLPLSTRQVTLLLNSIAKESVAIEMSGVATVNFSLVGTVSF